MTGGELQKYRDRLGISQQDLAEILNGALDKKYTSATVSGWETGKRPIPAANASFIETLILERSSSIPSGSPTGEERSEPAPDSFPYDTDYVAQAPTGSGGHWARVCTDLWSTLGLGTATAGALMGSRALVIDGQIISADAEALGAAWGQLAETNETFRKMLIGATAGGAWLQIGMVTSATAGKMWDNHRSIAAAQVHVVQQVEADAPLGPDAAYAAA